MSIDIEEYKRVTREIDVAISEIVEEYNQAIGLLKNKQEVVRIRLLMAFSFLEVVSNIYNLYFNFGLGNRELLEKWLGEYCFTDRNAEFVSHPYFKIITAERLYKFRCSIVHVLALPQEEDGVSITVPNGGESSELIRKMDEEFKKRGHTVAFISADGLMRLFIEGYRILHEQIYKNPMTATQSDLDGINRIQKEFERRGAKPVNLADLKLLSG